MDNKIIFYSWNFSIFIKNKFVVSHCYRKSDEIMNVRSHHAVSSCLLGKKHPRCTKCSLIKVILFERSATIKTWSVLKISLSNRQVYFGTWLNLVTLHSSSYSCTCYCARLQHNTILTSQWCDVSSSLNAAALFPLVRGRLKLQLEENNCL